MNFQLHIKRLPYAVMRTFTFHALDKALLVAAVLATVALAFINRAVLLVATRVHELLADRTLEKAFAALAAASN